MRQRLLLVPCRHSCLSVCLCVALCLSVPCRPREKANRPLTRRRRETAIECAEKLRYLRENLTKAMQLAELVILRERKKCDLHVSAALSPRTRRTSGSGGPA